MSGKRSSETGGSPAFKKMEFSNFSMGELEIDWPDPSPPDPTPPDLSPPTPPAYNFGMSPTNSFLSESIPSSEAVLLPLPAASQTDNLFFPSQLSISTTVSDHSQPSSMPPLLNQGFQLDYSISDDESFTSETSDLLSNFQFLPDSSNKPEDDTLHDALEAAAVSMGTTKTAELILENKDLKEELTRLILAETHSEFKKSLKKSLLTANKKSRRYLLSLSPRVLCQELKDSAPHMFQLLCEGLIGINTLDDVLENHHIMNIVAMCYSTIAKSVNRKASGYGLLLTTVARDGGLREDSMKVFCILCHPRTAQKLDKEILANGWERKLKQVLASESLQFHEIQGEDCLISRETSGHDAAMEVGLIRSMSGPQVQLVWDNLNLRSKHCFERQRDDYSAVNLDWMASLWIQERISAEHMRHTRGQALKEPENLNIQDFVPSQLEENFIFTGLVHYYSHRLVTRHPFVFKSLASCIKVTNRNTAVMYGLIRKI